MNDTNVADSPQAGPPGRFTSRPWLILVLVLAVTVAVRARLLAVPLERDEGEYAYAGQLLLRGFPPYTQAYNMKMPGIYALYALVMFVFGETHVGIHLGFLLINLATIVLMFYLGKALFDEWIGVCASAAYAVMSVSKGVLGFTANSEHFVLLPVVGGLVLLLKAAKSARAVHYLLSGLLLGSALVVKQHGMFFTAFGACYLLYVALPLRRDRWREGLKPLFVYGAGAAIPFVLACLILLSAGAFGQFRFWVFQYAAEYVSSSTLPLSVAVFHLSKNLWGVAMPCLLFWAFALVGVDASLSWSQVGRSRVVFTLGLLLFSLMSVCPGLYFRSHYFVLLLPSLSLLAAVGIDALSRLGFRRNFYDRSPRRFAGFVLGAVLFTTIYEHQYLFRLNEFQISRDVYRMNPFPESLAIAKFIKENTSPDDKIAVMGSEPQIYFYADRISATGYIYTYALMEGQKYALQMQQQMAREIEQSDPKMIVSVRHASSWMSRDETDTYIFEWFGEYQRGYELVGLVVSDDRQAVFHWGDDARRYDASKDNNVIYVFRKR